jgi:hypothetical protein
LVLQKIEANTIQISKTAARPLRGSKSFYHFLMEAVLSSSLESSTERRAVSILGIRDS